MKQHLLITISNYRFSTQFRLHRLAVWLLLTAGLVFITVFAWNSHQLQQFSTLASIKNSAYQRSKQTISQLNQVQNSLFNSLEQSQQQLRMLDSRLNELELLAGSEAGEFELDLEHRLKKAKISLFEKRMLLSKIPNGKPMDYWRVSSKFGVRMHPISHRRHSHIGMDLRASVGTPVYATADGFVEKARSNYDQGYGNMISLRHQMGFNTRYAHLDEVLVEFGQYVRKGELIGRCGNSGDSTAPHLHYEVAFLDKVLNPEPFLELTLANYEQITKSVRTVPWDSFQKEIRLLSLHPEQPSLPAEHASRVPSNSAVTFMSMAK